MLTVITGRNGSGKSQLLEGMQNGQITPVGDILGGSARLITGVELQTVSENMSRPDRTQTIAQLQHVAQGFAGPPGELGNYLSSSGFGLTSRQISAAETASGRKIGHWSDNDWARGRRRRSLQILCGGGVLAL
jgi:ATPase subunit of ABC transporter with duplicated ATPase domains